nr:hypothetical protein TorRG33x02_177420 [Ipomoea batatas]
MRFVLVPVTLAGVNKLESVDGVVQEAPRVQPQRHDTIIHPRCSPLLQWATPRCLITSRCLIGSHSRLNAPAAGELSFTHDVRLHFRPVLWFTPNFISGKSVSVGLSKLLHSSCPDEPSAFISRSTNSPESCKVSDTFRLVRLDETRFHRITSGVLIKLQICSHPALTQPLIVAPITNAVAVIPAIFPAATGAIITRILSGYGLDL